MYLTDEYNRGSTGYGEFSAGCNKCNRKGLQDSLAQPHAGVGSAAQPAKAKAFRALTREAGSISVNGQHGGNQGGQGIPTSAPSLKATLTAALLWPSSPSFCKMGRCFLSGSVGGIWASCSPAGWICQEDLSFYTHVPLGCCFELLRNQHLFSRGLLRDTAHALLAVEMQHLEMVVQPPEDRSTQPELEKVCCIICTACKGDPSLVPQVSEHQHVPPVLIQQKPKMDPQKIS